MMVWWLPGSHRRPLGSPPPPGRATTRRRAGPRGGGTTRRAPRCGTRSLGEWGRWSWCALVLVVSGGDAPTAAGSRGTPPRRRRPPRHGHDPHRNARRPATRRYPQLYSRASGSPTNTDRAGNNQHRSSWPASAHGDGRVAFIVVALSPPDLTDGLGAARSADWPMPSSPASTTGPGAGPIDPVLRVVHSGVAPVEGRGPMPTGTEQE